MPTTLVTTAEDDERVALAQKPFLKLLAKERAGVWKNGVESLLVNVFEGFEG